MDRHPDWCVIICLVGGGQEIHTGEAGIGEWLHAVQSHFPHWRVFASNELVDNEYGGVSTQEQLRMLRTHFEPDLHLKTSMRSFRSESVSYFVKKLLDLETEEARTAYQSVSQHYPIRLARSFEAARSWLRDQARGTERYGIMVSSYAERLRPLGIHLKSLVDPVKWFLEGKEHTDSSYYMELAATEFQVQGLELDWTCVAWDADFRCTPDGWENWSYRGSRWVKIRQERRQEYQKTPIVCFSLGLVKA